MKTPEEMAEEHANWRCSEQGPEYIVWCMCKDDFLAGYNAAKEQLNTAKASAELWLKDAKRYAKNAQYWKALVTAPKWISVKERLPEEDQNVLFCSSQAKDDYFVGYRVQEGAYYDPEGQGITTLNILRHCTHWMPLPAPPKEKE